MGIWGVLTNEQVIWYVGFMDEEILVKKLKARDQKVFQDFVNEYKDKLFRLAMGFVHDSFLAEDIVQDVFVKLWQNIDSWELGNAKLSTWLYKVTVNHALNVVRSKKKTSNVVDISQFVRESDDGGIEIQIPDNEKNPHNKLENKELAGILRKAINTLPKKQRIAFVLRQYQNMSSKEIAEVMDLSVSNVDVIIHRAKKNLQKQILKLMK